MKESLLKIHPEILSNSGLLDTFMVAVSNSKFVGTADGRKSIAILFNHGTSVVEVNNLYMVKKVNKQVLPIRALFFKMFIHFTSLDISWCC